MKRNFRPARPVQRPDQQFDLEFSSELMKFLIDAFPGRSRQKIKGLLLHKQVEVNGNAVSQFNHKLNPGDKIIVRGIRKSEEDVKQHFAIVYEDEHLIVVDKQSGILSIATDKEKKQTVYRQLQELVKRVNPLNKIFIVHRLDRETSGLMMFAKSIEVQRLLQENWRNTITERSYVAIAEGVFAEKEGTITSYLHENKGSLNMYSNENPVQGKKAITHYKVLKSNRQFSMLEIHLDTGRKNQIRVHLQKMGHPIVNDRKYGSVTNPIRRLGLHSRTLAFVHPVTKEQMHFTTPVPTKFVRLF